MRSRVPSFTPAERRIREARALVLRQAGATYVAIGRELGVSCGRARQITGQAEGLADAPRWVNPLPMRAQTFLYNLNLAELPELEAATAVARMSRRELLALPNIGRGAADALVAWLATHRLGLR